MTVAIPIDKILCGDAVELMRGRLPEESVHAIVTDPPYGISFMGEAWDTFQPEYLQRMMARESKRRPRSDGRKATGFQESTYAGIYDHSIKGQKEYQSWTTAWAREALRVLLPGASMLVMGGTRTYHRMACGVEDAGFEVKDTICWAYNSGFPKSQDLSMMFDKRGCRRQLVEKLGRVPTKAEFEEAWKSFGKVIGEKKFWGHNAGTGAGSFSKNRYEGQTGIVRFEPISAPVTPEAKEWNGFKIGGLKPSYEPVLWCVKPPEGPYVENVLKHGVGAINIEACRMPYEDDDDAKTAHINALGPVERYKTHKMIYGGGRKSAGFEYTFSASGRYPANMVRTDRFEDGYDRFYFVQKADRAERWFKCRICNVCQGGAHFRDHDAHALHCQDCGVDFPNTEEGRRAHEGHRTDSNIVSHPTVKPVSLGEFLIKLVTREGQIVLDPFTGLGSFLVSARNLNRHYIGFDNGSEYVEIARKRLATIPPPLEVFAGESIRG